MKPKIIANIDFCTLQQTTVVGVVKGDLNPTFGDKGGQFWRILLRMCIIICVCCKSGGEVWIGKNSSQTGRKGGGGGDRLTCAARWRSDRCSVRRGGFKPLIPDGGGFDSAWRARSTSLGNGGLDFA
jgi:hypothetical protein